jgi:hypothetical protein
MGAPQAEGAADQLRWVQRHGASKGQTRSLDIGPGAEDGEGVLGVFRHRKAGEGRQSRM